MPPAPTISDCVRRHRSDWISSWFHRFESGHEEAIPLNNQPAKWDPKSDGRIDPRTGELDPDNTGFGGPSGPECFETFLPAEPRIGYHGELLIITSGDLREYRYILKVNKAHAAAWRNYCQGNNHSIYRYRPSSGAVRPTTNSAGNRLLQEVALMFEMIFPCPPIALLEEERELVA